jgi:ADP-heptose:LPS heptosyltransferase
MAGTSPSVLVIRLDAIGDALALTPLLSAFGERSIRVDLVLTASNARVFSGRAARRAFVAPFGLRSSSPQNLQAIADFGGALREHGYSHVLVATEDPGGYRLARAIRAPYRVGFANGWGKPLKTLWVRSLVNHVVLRTAGLDPKKPHECEVLWKLGTSLLGDAEPPRDPKRLSPLILEDQVQHTSRTLFQFTDKWDRLGIPFESVCDAFEIIASQAQLHAIAATAEEAYACRAAQALGINVELFSSLDPWKAAIASAAAVVAPDSGAIHLAGMLGTPTVAVFPDSSNFAVQTARWAPWAAPHRIVRASNADDWPRAAASSLCELLRERSYRHVP